jgi:lysophospholipase L1-like esterase
MAPILAPAADTIGAGLPTGSAGDAAQTGLPSGSVVGAPVRRDANGRIVVNEQKLAPETCQPAASASLSPATKSVDILLLGASIAERWDKDVWQRHFGKESMVNEGVGGWTSTDILSLLTKEGLKVNPRLVILLTGSNDLEAGRDFGAVTENMREIARKICSLAPAAKVLVLGILPRGENPLNPLRAKIKAENRNLAQIADSKFIYFLDVGSVLVHPDGRLSQDISPDQVHFTERGYELITTAIQPTVEKLLAKPH